MPYVTTANHTDLENKVTALRREVQKLQKQVHLIQQDRCKENLTYNGRFKIQEDIRHMLIEDSLESAERIKELEKSLKAIKQERLHLTL